MNTEKLSTWGSGILLGLPIGVGLALLIGGPWTVGLGIVGTVAVNLLAKK